CDISCASIDNDGDQEEFKHILNNKPEALVGNPDSLLNTLNDHRFIFRQVDYLVIDDANSLIKQNQLPKVEGVLKRILSDYQTLIYADELTEKVKEFSLSTLDDGMSLGFDGTNGQLLGNPPTVEKGLNHSYIYVPNRMKITTLMAHIKEVSKDGYVNFTSSKRGTDLLYKTLRKQNYKATSLHGKLSEEKYKQLYNNFMNGDVQFRCCKNHITIFGYFLNMGHQSRNLYPVGHIDIAMIKTFFNRRRVAEQLPVCAIKSKAHTIVKGAQ